MSLIVAGRCISSQYPCTSCTSLSQRLYFGSNFRGAAHMPSGPCAWRMKTHGCPEETNMHHARTIHRQRLDGCPPYDRRCGSGNWMMASRNCSRVSSTIAIESPYGKACTRDTTHTKVAQRRAIWTRINKRNAFWPCIIPQKGEPKPCANYLLEPASVVGFGLCGIGGIGVGLDNAKLVQHLSRPFPPSSVRLGGRDL